ncbi:MAG: hypothetical protein AAGA60_17530, partial [Cyanobacteria bacterium P01_E01_bin.42]
MFLASGDWEGKPKTRSLLRDLLRDFSSGFAIVLPLIPFLTLSKTLKCQNDKPQSNPTPLKNTLDLLSRRWVRGGFGGV